ncbi:MAG: hypothetical protein ACYS0K_21895 [Planctomycetota bacterium]|jgi:hypothetical protein
MRFWIKPIALGLLALLAATPTSAVAGKDKSAFSIAITMKNTFDALGGAAPDWSGTFHASGALSGSGSATAPYYYDTIQIEGKKGSLVVVLTNIQYQRPRRKAQWDLTATFEIVGGTGVYAGLSGGGAASGTERWRCLFVDRTLGGCYVYRVTVNWQLDGAVNGG